MDFLTLAKSRYSVRAYQNRKVEAETLEKILLSAHVAPTAANRQPVKLIVVQKEEGLQKISKSANLYGAPLAVIVCADHSKVWTRSCDGKNTAQIDAAILTDHMMLQAADLGLGAVWICAFSPDSIREEFGLPDSLEPVNILAIGYPSQPPADPERHAAKRRPLSDLVCYETL